MFMNEYLIRLCRTGLTMEQAVSVYKNCMTEGGYKCVEEYLQEQKDVQEVSDKSVQ